MQGRGGAHTLPTYWFGNMSFYSSYMLGNNLNTMETFHWLMLVSSSGHRWVQKIELSLRGIHKRARAHTHTPNTAKYFSLQLCCEPHLSTSAATATLPFQTTYPPPFPNNPQSKYPLPQANWRSVKVKDHIYFTLYIFLKYMTCIKLLPFLLGSFFFFFSSVSLMTFLSVAHLTRFFPWVETEVT